MFQEEDNAYYSGDKGKVEIGPIQPETFDNAKALAAATNLLESIGGLSDPVSAQMLVDKLRAEANKPMYSGVGRLGYRDEEA